MKPLSLVKVALTMMFMTLACCGGAANAWGQSSAGAQSCAPAAPAVIINTDGSKTIDMGTCLLVQGASSAFTFDLQQSVLFHDLFRPLPITLTLEYFSPDTFTYSFTVWVCDNACDVMLSPQEKFTISGGGQISIPLPMMFAPGMVFRIVEHVEVADANSQCFAFGYYCYFQARFTLR